MGMESEQAGPQGYGTSGDRRDQRLSRPDNAGLLSGPPSDQCRQVRRLSSPSLTLSA